MIVKGPEKDDAKAALLGIRRARSVVTRLEKIDWPKGERGMYSIDVEPMRDGVRIDIFMFGSDGIDEDTREAIRLIARTTGMKVRREFSTSTGQIRWGVAQKASDKDGDFRVIWTLYTDSVGNCELIKIPLPEQDCFKFELKCHSDSGGELDA